MGIRIRPHHQRGIDNLVKEYEHDNRFLALIVGGSIAKGCAREDSDVDFMIVASDEEYSARLPTRDLFINRADLVDYEGGFVDGKIINLEYLNKVAEFGNEPSRAAFDGALIAFSKVQNFDEIIASINRYPEEQRGDKIRKFYSMTFIQHWLMQEAERHNNLYTKNRAASQLSLFAGRLILAYNRVLFPYHKWFYEYLERCPQIPGNLIVMMNELLVNPSLKKADSLFKSIKDFEDWGVTDLDAFKWFMEDVEWSWMEGKVSLEDW